MFVSLRWNLCTMYYYIFLNRIWIVFVYFLFHIQQKITCRFSTFFYPFIKSKNVGILTEEYLWVIEYIVINHFYLITCFVKLSFNDFSTHWLIYAKHCITILHFKVIPVDWLKVLKESHRLKEITKQKGVE